MSDGGYVTDKYLIEWASTIAFSQSDSYYGSITVPSATLLPALTSTGGALNGELIYNILNLSTGVAYYVRMSAHNLLGYGAVQVAPYSVVPAGKALAPGSVSVSPVDASTVTSANVQWTAPSSSVGSAITGYLVEWYEPYVSIPDVQLIQFISKVYPPTNGMFTLSFGPSPSTLETTNTLTYLTSAANIRSELISLGYSDVSSSNFSAVYPVGNVNVVRSALPGVGYQWLVTFLGQQNQGMYVEAVFIFIDTSIFFYNCCHYYHIVCNYSFFIDFYL